MKHTAAALLTALALSGVGPAVAAPKVAADIAPVHSLVARVMQGVGAPALILPPGASPHGYAMKPSQAAALAEAEAVFWVGPALAPWFGESVDALAGEARAVALTRVPGTTLLPVRTGVRFDGHAHGLEGAEHAAEEGGHGDAEDHGHAHHHDKADYGEHDADDGNEHAQHGQAEGAIDEHAWLDPENAKRWLDVIAETLTAIDPANAAAYRANARAGRAELDALMAGIEARLAPVRGRSFVVFHNAYHYFEHRFGIEAAGAVTLGDAIRPSAARVAEIRALLAETEAACVFAEPQFAPRILDTVVEGTGARQAVLDPLGAELEPGPGLYRALIENMARALSDCLAGR